MRARKNFIVVAYDIADDKRRAKVVKILEKAGFRVNFSVFECMVTDIQYDRLRKDIKSRIRQEEDTVIYYPICLSCYSKIIYQTAHMPVHTEVTVI